MKGGAPPALMPRDRAAVLSGLAAVVCIGAGPVMRIPTAIRNSPRMIAHKDFGH
jgi:hypothetical protein